MPGGFQSCQSEKCPRWYNRAWVLHELEKTDQRLFWVFFFFPELFQVALCFILMGMTKCCNPLSSRQNRFVIMPWIYQSIALGRYLSV